MIEAPVGRHSEKPAIVAEMIEREFPTVPKLEMSRGGSELVGRSGETRRTASRAHT